MQVCKNKYIPFKGFSAFNFFGVIFVRKEIKITKSLLQHEYIHTLQMREMLYIFFYLWYGVEYLTRLIFRKGNAYRSISFEREAYKNQDIVNYKEVRRRYSWVKHL